jgi:hypothetical protein
MFVETMFVEAIACGADPRQLQLSNLKSAFAVPPSGNAHSTFAWPSSSTMSFTVVLVRSTFTSNVEHCSGLIATSVHTS